MVKPRPDCVEDIKNPNEERKKEGEVEGRSVVGKGNDVGNMPQSEGHNSKKEEKGGSKLEKEVSKGAKKETKSDGVGVRRGVAKGEGIEEEHKDGEGFGKDSGGEVLEEEAKDEDGSTGETDDSEEEGRGTEGTHLIFLFCLSITKRTTKLGNIFFILPPLKCY